MSTHCFYWKSKVLRSTNIKCYLQIVFSCYLVLGRYTQTYPCFILLNLSDFLISVTCERGKTFLDTFTFAFSNPQVTKDVSLGLSPLNRKRCLNKVTMIGQPPVMPIYCSLAFGFWASTNCAIIGPYQDVIYHALSSIVL
jgi:hypothetical protein